MPELFDDQTAEPGKCGSCHFFDRRSSNFDTHGRCTIKLPPWVPIKAFLDKDWLDENGEGGRTVRDTDGCDLYEIATQAGSPTQYVKKRYWHAGAPS